MPAIPLLLRNGWRAASLLQSGTSSLILGGNSHITQAGQGDSLALAANDITCEFINGHRTLMFRFSQIAQPPNVLAVRLDAVHRQGI